MNHEMSLTNAERFLLRIVITQAPCKTVGEMRAANAVVDGLGLDDVTGIDPETADVRASYALSEDALQFTRAAFLVFLASGRVIGGGAKLALGLAGKLGIEE